MASKSAEAIASILTIHKANENRGMTVPQILEKTDSVNRVTLYRLLREEHSGFYPSKYPKYPKAYYYDYERLVRETDEIITDQTGGLTLIKKAAAVYEDAKEKESSMSLIGKYLCNITTGDKNMDVKVVEGLEAKQTEKIRWEDAIKYTSEGSDKSTDKSKRIARVIQLLAALNRNLIVEVPVIE